MEREPDGLDEVRVRGKSYPRDVPESGMTPPRLVPDGRRWERTEVSFGLAGRVACTALMLTPLAAFLRTGSVFWLLAFIASVPIGIWWIRDTWRRP